MTARRWLSTAARLSVPAALAAASLAPSSALANITPPVVLAGPSASVVELGNVALAADGSGGAIWRQLDADGRSHIYAARYRDGRWLGSQRIDTALPFDSFEPRIAAGPGGLLVAVFAQDWARQGSRTLFRLQTAVLKPGATRFEVPLTIDRSVGSDRSIATDLDPDLRMNEAGVAYLAYRVVTTTDANSVQRPGRGDVAATVKVARYAGGSWSVLGTANRNVSYTVPKPTVENAPRVSVDRLGNGVVAFLEPDDKGVARVYARRLFGARLGFVVKVSPQDIGGVALLGEADAFALAGGGLGAATAVVRQQAGPNSPLGGTRLFTAALPNAEQEAAKQFATPIQVDETASPLSAPATAMVGTEASSLVYAQGGTIRLARVTRNGPSAPRTIDGPAASGPPAFTLGPEASVTAWPATQGDAPIVAVAQALPEGESASARLTSGTRGAILDLSVGGSGLGDALVAFRQGSGSDNQIVAAAVQVAPQPFLIAGPREDWSRPNQASVTWERAASGVGGLRYDVLLNGQVVARNLTGTFAQLPADALDDGTHRVRVRARDLSGQASLSNTISVQIDGAPPEAIAEVRSGRRVTVRVLDRANGTEGASSGVNATKTSIRWGNGTATVQRKTASHRFRRAGSYVISVKTRDKAGNGTTIKLRVNVR